MKQRDGVGDPSLLVHITFDGTVIHWRGPSPFYFVELPAEHVTELSHAAKSVSYGWGVVPAEVRIRQVEFRTSLIPRNGGFLLPLKVAVRKATGGGLGDTVRIELKVRIDR